MPEMKQAFGMRVFQRVLLVGASMKSVFSNYALFSVSVVLVELFVLTLICSGLHVTFSRRLALAGVQSGNSLLAGFAIAILFGLVSQAIGAYQPGRLGRFLRAVLAAALAWCAVAAIVLFLAQGLGVRSPASFVMSLLVVGLPVTILMRTFVGLYSRRAVENGTFLDLRLLLLSDRGGDEDRLLIRALERNGDKVVAHVALGADGLGSPNQLYEAAERTIKLAHEARAHGVVLTLTPKQLGHAQALVGRFRHTTLTVKLAMASDAHQGAAGDDGRLSLVVLHAPPLHSSERAAKRALDVVVAGLALFTLAPLMLMVAIAVRLDSSGPILTRQWRSGLEGKPFRILAFRSTAVAENAESSDRTQQPDVRLTRVGAFLREASLDELPQLFNVIFGELSLVGPQPRPIAHDRFYAPLIADYAFRQQVKPGLTGWAQVCRGRNAAPTLATMEEDLRKDVWYIHNWSFRQDLRILARSAIRLLDIRQAT